jgi:ribonuclease HI
LLDYSKAYDTVWREELLLGMLKKGVPERMVRWCLGFLRNRQARVRLDGTKGHVWKMRQGLPQGAVMSPLLFLFYIDAVRGVVPKGVNVSMYADDLALYALHPDKEKAQAMVQAAVDAVDRWSLGKKLKLNAAKCEVTFFSNYTGEAHWIPSIAIRGTPLTYNKTPTFLGIVFDRTLSFGPQVEAVRKKVSGKCNLLAVVGSKEWGWKKEYLKRVFQSTVGSVLNYCGAAWQPWLSDSNVEYLDACQNRALRVVTGQLRSSPLEAIRAEADVPSMRTTIRRNCAVAWEKTLRLPVSNPRAHLCIGTVHRLKSKGSWRELARELEEVTGLGGFPRLNLPVQEPPWLCPVERRWSVRADMSVNTRDLTSPQLFEVALEEVGCHGPFEFTIYSDGTPGDMRHDSGAAAVVTRGTLRNPEKVEIRRRRGRAIASAYEAEVEGLKLAVSWVRDAGQGCQGPVLICTDCRAITVGLQPSNVMEDVECRELRGLLDELQVAVLVQWVPGHAGLQGNEWADAEAGKASTGRRCREDVGKGVSFSSAKARIRRTIQDPPIAHARTRAIYQGARGDESSLTRRESVLLAQLRSGHCLKLAAYKKVIDDTADPMCPLCGREPETVVHWLQQCPASAARRVAEFGVASPPLTVLFKDPVAVLAFTRGSWAA